MTSLSETSMLAGSSGVTSGYTIDQSIRFNSGDSTYMQRTHGAGGNVDKWTLSFWFKRSKLGADQYVFGSGANVYNTSDIMFKDDDTLIFWSYISAYQTRLITSQVFRDPSAWYHLVIVYDSGNDVANQRAKMYINGNRVTDFSTETYPSQNQDGIVGSNANIGFGRYISYGGSHFDGYLAEMHYVNGYDYGPENFGEFKEDTDIWIPKEFEGNYGTGGFKVDGRDSSDLGDDESGQGNDLTTSGLAAHDQVTDTPTNNFCVMNPLANPGGATFSEGNLKVTMASGTKKGTYSSFAIDSGKWYVEGRLTSNNNGSQYAYTGIEDYNAAINSGQYIGRDTYGYSYDPANGGVLNNNSYVVASGTLASLAQNDIVQIAVDLDNNAIYWGKNGTFLNSGNPASGASKTGGVSVTAASSQPSRHYHIGHGNGTGSSGYQSEIVWNFGQDGTFAGGTTAGGNSDGNGKGNFKYSVPSGYLALCTSNLGS